MNKRLSDWFYKLLRTLLGAVFIYSGAVKLADVKGFAKIISQYDLVPDLLLAPVAIGLPLLELLAGLGLVFEITFSLSLISGMLIMFVVVLWYGILKNLDVDCGCFSTEELRGQHGLKLAFYRDIAMLFTCICLYLYRYMENRGGQNQYSWSRIRRII